MIFSTIVIMLIFYYIWEFYCFPLKYAHIGTKIKWNFWAYYEYKPINQIQTKKLITKYVNLTKMMVWIKFITLSFELFPSCKI